MNNDKVFSKEELKQFREQRNLTQKQLADILGLHKNYIAMLENIADPKLKPNVSREISYKFMNNLKEHFPDVFDFKISHLNTDMFKNSNFVPLKLPFVRNFPASAGKGTYILDEVPVEDSFYFDKRFIKNVIGITNTSNLYIVQAEGNSMADKIQDRDLLIVDASQIEGKGVFVINQNGSTRVKRIQKDLNGDIVIISDNPDKNIYPDEVLKAKEQNDTNFVTVIGKVVWNLSRGIV